ncbi:hypothetical protein, partial [Klebsiella variicola]|uniref:hypothetical protein n=1 Tax=Klebsiella variicola TaxID=244366 RepID=UPI0039C318B1
GELVMLPMTQKLPNLHFSHSRWRNPPPAFAPWNMLTFHQTILIFLAEPFLSSRWTVRRVR